MSNLIMNWFQSRYKTYQVEAKERQAVHDMLVKTMTDFDKMPTEQQTSANLASVRQLKVCLASSIVVPIAVFTLSSMIGVSFFRRIGVSNGRAFLLSSLSGACVGGWLAARQFSTCQTSFLEADDAGGARARVYLRDMRPNHPALIAHPIETDLNLLQTSEINQLISEHQSK